MATPYKVVDEKGHLLASCKHLEDAASIVDNHGIHTRIKLWNRVLWHEGREPHLAGVSVKYLLWLCNERIRRDNYRWKPS